jgi:hypothetical protein
LSTLWWSYCIFTLAICSFILVCNAICRSSCARWMSKAVSCSVYHRSSVYEGIHIYSNGSVL